MEPIGSGDNTTRIGSSRLLDELFTPNVGIRNNIEDWKLVNPDFSALRFVIRTRI